MGYEGRDIGGNEEEMQEETGGEVHTEEGHPTFLYMLYGEQVHMKP